MTCIIATTKKVVADRKLVIDDDYYIGVTKIFKTKSGDIVGTAGESEDGEAFLDWYQKRQQKAKPKIGEDFEALVLTREGVIMWFDKSLYYVKPDTDYFAIGCGAKSALILLKLGKDPKEAIELISEVDNNVGRETDTLEI